MVGSGIKTGMRANILKLMNANKKTLWSSPDILSEHPESSDKAIVAILRVLRVDKLITRHIDNDSEGDRQYAVSINEDKIDVYVPQSQSSGDMNSLGKKKRKGALPTSKEIRSMFAAHYNNMAKLEDSVMSIIDRFEEMDKEMNKIRNFLK